MKSLLKNEAALEASRHLCQEARVVLTSLRGGPPNVARGDLAQDLMDLRGLIKNSIYNEAPSDDNIAAPLVNTNLNRNGISSTSAPTPTTPDAPPSDDLSSGLEPPSSSTISPTSSSTTTTASATAIRPQQDMPDDDVRPFARPFLAVVMDPRAAGPHTLVALRSLHRLLQRKSLIPLSRTDHMFSVSLEGLMKGILNCKFEQTDAGADEAVEMAIADLLALIVQLDRRSIQSETLMDAFNTVFVTRNTFVHSPALCYHFEDVLTTMIKAVFGDLVDLWDHSGRLIFEFLVNQLLHTPLVGGDDEASREAQLAHDATRVLCLRLARAALRTGFPLFDDETLMKEVLAAQQQQQQHGEERNLLQVIQDDLCLSLLMTGQAIWAFQDNDNIAPGFISLEVLSEICSTLSALWTNSSLRKHLVPQFESIFTGFYERALVLLRKRINPIDSSSFHTNLVFDAGVEVILESLVDIMCLHDHQQTVAQGNGGTLETLFATYDCNMKRSDVAIGLMIELCRCSGSKVDEDGDILNTPLPSEVTTPRSNSPPPTPVPDVDVEDVDDEKDLVNMSDAWRQVPPHLKELCAEAIIGGMKCLFRDDHPSENTMMERNNRESIMAGHVPPAPQSFSDLNRITSVHHLRNLKSQKRLMRRAAQLFNKKPSKGIEYLVDSGIITKPVSPRSVASFLRNGIVVGLDKKAVGGYLGEVGKSPQPGKSPPDWDRDWFHKEVLQTYCSLFRFEKQSLLDGLRMFLAAFRLPGEAQQIDRILQAFSDSCSRLCDESAHSTSKLFSEDQKRASDAAYLLSFSIIMLNTDQHNENIREDRKMTKSDFVKNNANYGSDITEPGKEFPSEYLAGIYDSIREEEIRTEGEGADGSMTVERWKDVLRGSADEEEHAKELPTSNDAEDLTELVLEHVWMPIMSAIGALWGTNPATGSFASTIPPETGTGGMLGAQGSRLGMDMAWEMLVGVRQLGRNDLFRKIFNCVCKFSGLLDYQSDAADRTWKFANTVESQGAFIIALQTAHDAPSEIGIDGWKRIWLMLFELRDLKVIGGGVSRKRNSVLTESDPDLLKEDARRDWTMKLIKRGKIDSESGRSSGYSMLGAVGRALFGSVDDPSTVEPPSPTAEVQRTVHGKEDHVVWDELAPSDDEDEVDDTTDDESKVSFSLHGESRLSPGSQFENLLVREDILIKEQREMPVTGLERVDDTEASRPSPRRRVRKRLLKCCDFSGFVPESRFMDDEGLNTLFESLLSLLPVAASANSTSSMSAQETDPSTSSEFSSDSESIPQNPISPASAAFAEVLLCELALRNRDRLTVLWHNHLKPHYAMGLVRLSNTCTSDEKEHMKIMSGAIEKNTSGLLRISCCAVQRGEIANDVLDTWKLLDQVEVDGENKCLMNSLDRHLAEGLWRMTRIIDVESQLDNRGWEGLLSLCRWCACRGRQLPPVRSNGIGRPVGLAEDDPALQAYRSLHYLLNVSEIKDSLPTSTVGCVDTLIVAGEKRGCPKLSIAGLDLLYVLSSSMESKEVENSEVGDEARDAFWVNSWRPVLESMAQASRSSTNSNVRQHSLSMLTDSFLDKRIGFIPIDHLCSILGELCIPLAGERIIGLREGKVLNDNFDELMIELELCIGLIFKPLRHHLKNIVNEGQVVLLSLWNPILNVLKEILQDPGAENGDHGPSKVIHSTNELALEHFRNVIMVLVDFGVLKAEPDAPDDVTAITWDAVSKMDFGKRFLEEWQQAARQAQ